MSRSARLFARGLPLRGLLVALLAGVVALPPSAAAGTGATPPAAATSAASYGGGWLARLITAAGGHVPIDPARPTTSAPDPSGTADAVLALHAAGVGGVQADAALSWLEANYEGYVRVSGADVPGALAKLILVAHASGVDPRAFGTAPTDLVARLLGTERSGGADAGLFGSQDPTFDGSYRQGLALLALSAVRRTDAPAVRWLKGQQCSGGGWLGYRADTSVPCPAPDPASFSGPDTNGTSLAFQGLRAEGTAPRVDPLVFLAGVQSDDGGWGYVGGRAVPADPNSTALVIQALLAAGEDPTAARWVRGGATPYDALLRFALGCSAPVAGRGAFYFDVGDGTRKPNVLATVQAVPAAAGMFFPLAASTPGAGLPTVTCAAPTPSPSAGPTPSAGPSASSAPSPAASGVAAASAAAGTLPDTGAPANLAILTAAGALLLLVGAGLLVLGRRQGGRAR